MGERMEDADGLHQSGCNLVLEAGHFLSSICLVCRRGRYTNENLAIVRKMETNAEKATVLFF